MSPLENLSTPSLVIEENVMRRNLTRMSERVGGLGCVLRPHVKTHKSLPITKIIIETGNVRGITVSTLVEARYFYKGDYSDIMYGVGLSDGKVSEVADLIRAGCKLTCITDNLIMAKRIASAAAQENITIPLLIELDVDGHRSGIEPESNDLIELARFIDASASLNFKGVMTHAGDSYSARTPQELSFHAEREVQKTLMAVGKLEEAELKCSTVSVGSTPTASSYKNLDGITEVRAGVYVFYDLVQAGIGVAHRDDIALSVLATVIGHQPNKGWVITDAGWMALSRDRGTSGQVIDFGYGQVCDLQGAEYEGITVVAANQEHGIIAAKPGGPIIDFETFPVGSQVRIKPNHACATSGQFDSYDVLTGSGKLMNWPRLQGRR